MDAVTVSVVALNGGVVPPAGDTLSQFWSLPASNVIACAVWLLRKTGCDAGAGPPSRNENDNAPGDTEVLPEMVVMLPVPVKCAVPTLEPLPAQV